MNPDVVLTLLVVAIPMITLSLGFGWYRAARQLRQLRASLPETFTTEDRLAHVEQVLEGVAVQNERLAEAQDFLSRVVADRLPLPPTRDTSPSRQATPH